MVGHAFGIPSVSASNRLRRGEARFSSGMIRFEKAKKKNLTLLFPKVFERLPLPSSQLRRIGRVNLFIPRAAARPLIPCTATCGRQLSRTLGSPPFEPLAFPNAVWSDEKRREQLSRDPRPPTPSRHAIDQRAVIKPPLN